MPEPHAGAELEQAGRDRRRRVADSDTEAVGRPPHEHRLARRRPPPRATAAAFPPEATPTTRAARPAARTRRRAPPASTRRAVPAAPADCPVSRRRSGRARVRPAAHGSPTEAARVRHPRADPRRRARAVPEALLLGSHARREDQGDRLRHQTTPDQAERLRRGPVQPLRVVDHTERREVTGHVRHQAQRGQADEEAIRRERVTSGTRQTLEPVRESCARFGVESETEPAFAGLPQPCARRAPLAPPRTVSRSRSSVRHSLRRPSNPRCGIGLAMDPARPTPGTHQPLG
jgi:hypothetical protein